MTAAHKGPVAVVTGGSQGIGQAVTDRLTRDGVTVEVFDIGCEAAVDVTDPNAVAAAVSRIVRCHRRIDILVNNVGIFPHAAFDELDFGAWRRVLATNLDSVFVCSKAVYPWMKQRRYGRIINVSSSAFFVGDFDLTHYAASKGGIIGFTRSLAKGAGRHGITVNSVAPGFIETPGVLASPEERALFDDIVSEQSIPRRGKPEDVAACVSYLASPEASFITGQLINVDGGHRFI
ncbi:SDR family NAD(P)-dependent oxidoreductase [Nocardia sp. NPDC004168]|uniref:SDR family oxidoreductase n=1 Tax=Nocardia sp. NPDC004168 TaxID=3154452 RepID=UPI0033A15224